MNRSFVLGILGGIFSFLAGMFAFFIMALAQASGAVDVDLTVNIVLAFLAGVLGIIGGVLGAKRGGIILIISAVLALIATSLFGILPFILLLVSGMLAFRERKALEREFVAIAGVSPEGTKKESRRNVLLYITLVSCAAATGSFILNGLAFYRGLYPQPRAKLTVSIDSFQVTSSDNWASMSVPVRVSNYSPKKAYIKDWNLTLIFSNSAFQFPNENCSYGTTVLDPTQQTEYIFSYDITNNTSIDVNTLQTLVFAISYIDDQGTQEQQFEFIRPHH